MAFPFKRILAPVDFDESSLSALELAAQLAKPNDGTVFILHIVPVDMDVSGMPQYVDLIKRQENVDRDKLTAIAKQHLADVKWEILDQMGPPAEVISNPELRRRYALKALRLAHQRHDAKVVGELLEAALGGVVGGTVPSVLAAVGQ